MVVGAAAASERLYVIPPQPLGRQRMSFVSEFLDAAAVGDTVSVKKMLKGDPALAKACDDMGFTALHNAVGEDYPQLVKLLIEAGADVSAANDEGMTPL
jgi:ankyrin repeat protein